MKLQVSTILFVATIGLVKAGTFLEDAAAAGSYALLIDAISPETLATVTAAFPVTVFAPQDSAFGEIANDLSDMTDEDLQAIIAGHVVAGEFRAADVIAAGCVELQSLNPDMMLKVSYSEAEGVMVNNATVVEADVGDTDSTGVLHGIDKFILPGSFSPCPSMEPSTTMMPSPSPSTSLAPSTSMAPIPVTEAPTGMPVVASDPTAAPAGSSASKFSAMIGSLATVLVGYMIA